MIQDIAPHRLENQFDSTAKVRTEDRIVCARGMELLVKIQSEALFPTFGQCTELKEEDVLFLFRVDGIRFFLLNSTKVMKLEGYEFVNVRELREKNQIPRHLAFAANTAKHLADWYRDNRYCGRCAKAMKPGEKERSLICSSCGYTVYPRIMPAVIVGVRNGEKLLITRYRVGYRHNALIAGFTEIGETVEETVQREVMEEAGIRVKNITYYKSQPWGMANDLLLGFFCDLDGDDTIRMDGEELSYAEWVRREEIEQQPDDYSLTNEMMKMFKEGKM